MATRQEIEAGSGLYGLQKGPNKAFKLSRPAALPPSSAIKDQTPGRAITQSRGQTGTARARVERFHPAGRADRGERSAAGVNRAIFAISQVSGGPGHAHSGGSSASTTRFEPPANMDMFGGMSGGGKKVKKASTYSRSQADAAPSTATKKRASKAADTTSSQESDNTSKDTHQGLRPQDTAKRRREPGGFKEIPTGDHKVATPTHAGRFKPPRDVAASKSSPDASSVPTFRPIRGIVSPLPKRTKRNFEKPTSSSGSNGFRIAGLRDDEAPSSPITVPDTGSPPIASQDFVPEEFARITDDEDDNGSNHIECPICGQQIDRALYKTLINDTHDPNYRLNVSEQVKLCRRHKIASAQAQWSARNLPTIDWENLDKRMKRHLPQLRSILTDPSIPSHFRDKLAEVVSGTEDRTLAQAISHDTASHLTPGYYGSYGGNLMNEFIITELGDDIRAHAGTSRLIGFGGASAYVQTVLAPEMATALVMEDLGIGEEEARRVLGETAEIGELLNDADRRRTKGRGRRKRDEVEGGDDEG